PASSPSVLLTLSLHDALPIFFGRDAEIAEPEVPDLDRLIRIRSIVPRHVHVIVIAVDLQNVPRVRLAVGPVIFIDIPDHFRALEDRKSTRLNSSHVSISYAVF